MKILDNTEHQDSPVKFNKREQNRIKWFNYFKKLAEEKGGKVLSTKYERMHAKMHFQCKSGHDFWAKCHDIRQKGTWCPKCAGNERLTIENLREAAANNGGILFSQIYLGIDVDHMWACSKGHQFTHTPLNVLYNKAWCPICTKEKQKKKRKEKRLKSIQDIAEKQGGKIISSEYVNSRTPMECKCKNGHLFSKSAEKIIHGEWCPECD